jgi:phosphopantetheinyl transferase
LLLPRRPSQDCFPVSELFARNRGVPAGRIFAAFAARQVGLDVESADRQVRALALARKLFQAQEAKSLELLSDLERAGTFLRYWVCKEATVKLSGDGIYYGLRYVQVDLKSDGRSRGRYKGRKVWLREFQPAEGLLAALASWEPLEMKSFLQV